MTRYILFFLSILTLSIIFYSDKNISSRLPNYEMDGRCTGSSYCSACSNCSRCMHCSNGGSCGVCSGGSSSRSNFRPAYSTSGSSSKKSKARKVKSRSYSAPTNFYNEKTESANETEIQSETFLTVKTSILNVRSGPGIEYDVLAILKKGDTIRCIETSSADWIEIEVVETGVVGYVYKKLL